MTNQDPKMVLRTVYLPPDLDEKLRVKAFRANVTKGDLIRQGLALVLDDAEPGEVANLTPVPASAEHLHAQYLASWLKLAGDAVADRKMITAEGRRKLVKAAENILAAAGRPVAKRAATPARNVDAGSAAK